LAPNVQSRGHGSRQRRGRIGLIHNTMKDWHNEEEIKAQLRELTNETRKLRNDLYQLIRPSKTLNPRAFIHDRAVARHADRTVEPEVPEPDEER
jgi:hypothetical protein